MDGRLKIPENRSAASRLFKPSLWIFPYACTDAALSVDEDHRNFGCSSCHIIIVRSILIIKLRFSLIIKKLSFQSSKQLRCCGLIFVCEIFVLL